MITSGPGLDKEGLVFGYDTGAGIPLNIRRGRYYAGRPTTNYVAYNNAVRQASYTDYSATSSGTWNAKHPHAIRAYNAQGTDITGYVNTGVTDWTNTYHAHWQYDDELKKPVVVMDAFDGNWKAKSYSVLTTAWTNYGMTTGSKYVISWLQWTTNISKAVHVGVYCKNSSSSNNFWDGLSGGSTTSKNTKPYTWQRVYHVYTVSSNHDVTIDYETIYMYGHSLGPNSVGTTIKIADVQIELNTDYPSAYLDSLPNSSTHTRSNTESLRDIARNASIDVSNTSFDSSGFLTFDGTDDYFTTTLTGVNLDNACTIEGVLKRKTTPSAWRTFFNIKPSGANTPFFEFRSNANAQHIYADYYNGTDYVTNAASLATGTYGHAVATYDGAGNIKMYLNGELIHTKTGVPSFALGTSPRLTVGRAYSNDRYTDIEAPVVKVYNKALSDSEVKRNYSTYKTRFGI